ncbi:MAG: sigma-70 family RNA polymerase sigma factor [Deltaproteobacteria bacterium]|nr:sigma-70 family RNA polymerase sigma factor [Kofleriaceae bacterium]
MADDRELLERWRGGDRDAGQALFERHFESIYGFFVNKCESEVDELVQATFLACVRAREQFRGDSSFRTYLFTIARHELYRALRTLRRDGDRLDFLETSLAELVTTPATRLGRNADHKRLLEAMATLPVEQQLLLELHYWEDTDITALATIFEAPAVTVRSRLHRARKALRARLEAGPMERAVDESDEGFDQWARSVATRE